MMVPPPLSPEASIRVVAASGPYDAAELGNGLARLTPWAVRAPEPSERDGFFAAPEAQRQAELQSALDDPQVDAIWLARGGYGLGPLLPSLDWTRFMKRPKWFVGFSDATAVHAQLWQRGVQSVHAANGTTLARQSDRDWQRLVACLEGRNPPLSRRLEVLCHGQAAGPLVGGNLTVLATEAAAGTLSIPAGAILMLEDVTETSYRIDRMLDALRRGGHLDGASAIVFGEFTQCSAGKFEVPVSTVLARFASRWGRPTVSGLPSGHGEDNLPLVFGAEARVSDGTLILAGSDSMSAPNRVS